jgi:U4/U6.U5 tri-snRNP-associated protein 2
VENQQVSVRADTGTGAKPLFDIDRGISVFLFTQLHVIDTNHQEIKTTVSPFLFLAVDLPPPPLFQDAVEKNIIPQVTIQSVLAKYDGRTTQVRNFY